MRPLHLRQPGDKSVTYWTDIDVQTGATYTITRDGHVVGRIVAPDGAADMTPPKKSGAAQTYLLDRVELTSASSIDELIDDARGDW